VLELTNVAAVQALDLIAIFGVHDHILITVLKHEEMLSEPAQLPVPVIAGVITAHLLTALVNYGVLVPIE